MWTYTLAILMVVAIFAFIVAVPVCLGVLLRLLLRNAKPKLVGWFGAALILAPLYLSGYKVVETSRMMNGLTPSCDSFQVTFSMGTIELIVSLFPVFMLTAVLLFQLCLVSMLVGWGVNLVDEQAEKQSGRFWLVMCPIIAVTVYGGLMFGLMWLYLGMGKQGRFSYLFAVLYRFFLWEILFVLCVTLAITLFCLNRRKTQTSNNQIQTIVASAPNSDL